MLLGGPHGSTAVLVCKRKLVRHKRAARRVSTFLSVCLENLLTLLVTLSNLCMCSLSTVHTCNELSRNQAEAAPVTGACSYALVLEQSSTTS